MVIKALVVCECDVCNNTAIYAYFALFLSLLIAK